MNDKDLKKTQAPYSERNKALLEAVHESAASIGADIEPILSIYNEKLSSLADQIKLKQPNTQGAITLHLAPCGPRCLGCPHPVFYKWFNPRPGSKKWTTDIAKNPLVYMRRKERFDDVRPLILEAQSVIQKRSAFIKQVSALNKTIIMLTKHDKHGLFIVDKRD